MARKGQKENVVNDCESLEERVERSEVGEEKRDTNIYKTPTNEMDSVNNHDNEWDNLLSCRSKQDKTLKSYPELECDKIDVKSADEFFADV